MIPEREHLESVDGLAEECRRKTGKGGEREGGGADRSNHSTLTRGSGIKSFSP